MPAAAAVRHGSRALPRPARVCGPVHGRPQSNVLPRPDGSSGRAARTPHAVREGDGRSGGEIGNGRGSAALQSHAADLRLGLRMAGEASAMPCRIAGAKHEQIDLRSAAGFWALDHQFILSSHPSFTLSIHCHAESQTPGGKAASSIVDARKLHDADGNGIGDWPVITRNFLTLEWLGSMRSWLTRSYPSPLPIGGYAHARTSPSVHPDLRRSSRRVGCCWKPPLHGLRGVSTWC